MQKNTRKIIPESALKTPGHIAVLAIVTEMARNLGANISKVKLNPLPVVDLTGDVAGVGKKA
jgi:hypothetical protein